MSEPENATVNTTQEPANLNPPPANSEAQSSVEPGSDMTTDQQEKPSAEQESANNAAGQNAASEFSETQAPESADLQSAGTNKKTHR